MAHPAGPWSIVLAAGDGKRLQSLTTDPGGTAIPKQFCSLFGGSSLLRDALRRAAAVAPRERLCAIVAAQHERWWRREVADLSGENVFVQPENRGTAIGILLPLLHIARRDPEATIVLLPSDHHVHDEPILAEALRTAARQVCDTDGRIVLLGIAPEDADVELGYIVPDRALPEGLSTVARFLEKPATPLAEGLIGQGALWNSFILAAPARSLLGLFDCKMPRVVASLRRALERDGYRPAGGPALAAEYAALQALDFSRHLLDGAESLLRVKSVPACGWSDLGTPRRVAATLRRRPVRDERAAAADTWQADMPCLAVRHAHHRAMSAGSLPSGAP